MLACVIILHIFNAIRQITHHCPKHSMLNGQFCCLWLFPCLRYVHVCNWFHWMAWKQRLNYEFRHTWWITGSRRYQKKLFARQRIYEIYMQKPEKPSLSIRCATLFQKPLIIQGSFFLGGGECCTNIFLTELRLGI